MQPTLMKPEQIETAVRAAQRDILGLIIDLPHGELVVADANDLRDTGNLHFALGDAVIFDLSQAVHVRAVERTEIANTCFTWRP